MSKIRKKTVSACTALMLTAAMILSGPASSVYATEAASDQIPSLSENGLVTEAEGIAINADNFPDENFRKFISESCDTGYSYYNEETYTWIDDIGVHDGILSPQEIEKVSHIWISGKGIYSLKGIEFFTELEYLDADNNYLSELDLSSNPALTTLDIGSNYFTVLDISAYTALKTLHCGGNQLTSLDISGNKNITYLSCGENKLSSLVLNDSLTELYCSDNELTALELPKTLTKLGCRDNKLTSLDLPQGLIELSVSRNRISKLDISQCSRLEELSCESNRLDSLNTNGAVNLKTLDCEYNNLTSLDVSSLRQLVSLDCNSNMLTSLDVSNNVYLKTLYCNDNYLVCLDLSKNSSLTNFRSYQYARQADFTRSFVKNMGDYDSYYNYYDIYRADIALSQFLGLESSRVSFDDTDYGNYNGNLSKAGNILSINVVYTNDHITEKNISIWSNGREHKTGGALLGVLKSISSSGYPNFGSDYFCYNYDCGNGFKMECRLKLNNSPDSAKLGRFIDRLYQVSLDRDGDSDGKSYWVDSLSNGTYTGTEAAFGFVFSPEFKEKNLCNECYVKQLYIAFMGRECDADGLNYWVGLLEGGMTREEVFNGFAGSPEFNGICYSYGIETGGGVDLPLYGTVPTGKCSICQKEDGVTSFIKRLYSICMDRDAEEGGLSYWTAGLWNHELTGYNAAYGFIFCPEFTAKNLNNEQYIEYLYKAFMGRECDAGEVAYWIEEMNSGKTSEDIFNSFAGSNEFTMICNRYGIKRD